jgi:hypothetical protein
VSDQRRTAQGEDSPEAFLRRWTEQGFEHIPGNIFASGRGKSVLVSPELIKKKKKVRRPKYSEQARAEVTGHACGEKQGRASV